MFWTIHYFSNEAFCFVIVWLYLRLNPDISESEGERYWLVVSLLFVFAALCFVFFLSIIDSRFIRTWYDTRTGKEFTCDSFLDPKCDDAAKFDVFRKHPSQYAAIKPEVAAWVRLNWEKWKYERPVWVNDDLLMLIPIDLIPRLHIANEKAKREHQQVHGRRKSGYGNLIGIVGAVEQSASGVVEDQPTSHFSRGSQLEKRIG